MNDKKAEIGSSGNGGVGGPEVVQRTFTKPTAVSIVACNWSGGPTGEVTDTFTPGATK